MRLHEAIAPALLIRAAARIVRRIAVLLARLLEASILPVAAICAILTIWTIWTILTLLPMLVPVGTILLAILAIGPVVAILAVAEALRVVAAALAVETLVVVVLVIVHARLRLHLVTRRLHHRLHLAVITLVVELIAGIHGIVRHELTRAVQALAVHLLAVRPHVLLTEGHDDAIIVLGVLEIVLSEHRVAGGRGIARKRNVLLGDVRRSTSELHVRSRAFEAARERALSLAVTPATSAVLLSLPHWLRSQS
jgi:hypothetical protein